MGGQLTFQIFTNFRICKTVSFHVKQIQSNDKLILGAFINKVSLEGEREANIAKKGEGQVYLCNI